MIFRSCIRFISEDEPPPDVSPLTPDPPHHADTAIFAWETLTFAWTVAPSQWSVYPKLSILVLISEARVRVHDS